MENRMVKLGTYNENTPRGHSYEVEKPEAVAENQDEEKESEE